MGFKRPLMNKIMDKKKKKTWIQYGIFAVVAIFLYATGLHTEVIGFAQRGLLATGLMNPDVAEIAQARNNENTEAITEKLSLTEGDYNLKLTDRDGNIHSLEEFKGKVIFLNFWATWCPPCVAEMPSIDKLHEEMGDDVAFVLLSFDDDFEKAKAFDKRKGYNLPIYAPASNLPAMFQSSALPTTYVIDAKGNLALTHKGMADYSDPEFKNFLNSLK
ncbi:thiol-disulfide isomerase-like thioredoxin [Galbibacter orientalis DSM 19592]|mgnify:CR=1 FL=1|uniref:Thiol-disulfide isomerase-like thioredoxin n=2 Tax=Galbibacter TaxID=379068 RepID=I3C1W5_9FLAO|nr:thiol-disulfide isomerase-like thioredoxin [Galbibacter orientalis DSM 19592]